MRLGITIPLADPLARHGEILRGLEAAGYTDLWTAETAGTDAFAPLAQAAAVTAQVRLGTAIASAFARGPALLAMTAAALAEAAPGRFALGLGAASPTLVTDWNGLPYVRPLTRVRDTIRFLRAAFTGQRVDASYESFTVRGFRLDRPPAEPPPVLIAALRAKMLALAVEEADGVILNWLSASDVHTVVPARRDSWDVVARILVCPSEDSAAVRAGARALIAGYLSVPAYAEYHRWLGHAATLCRTCGSSGSGASVARRPTPFRTKSSTRSSCTALRRSAQPGLMTTFVPVSMFRCLLALDPACDLLGGALALAEALA